MKIIRGHHFSFAVSDLARAKHFYGEVLGLHEIDRPDFSFDGAWYQCGETQVHLIHNPDGVVPGKILTSRANHSAFQIESVDDAIESLQSAGVEFSDKNRAARQLFLQDPDGNFIELIEPGGRLGQKAAD